MELFRGLIVAVVLLTTLRAPAGVEGDVHSLQRWMAVHGRSYSTAEEQQHRQQIYHANIRRFEEFNSTGGRTYLLGEGPYTDLTDDEFVALLRPRRTRPTVHVGLAEIHDTGSVEVPSSVDWREVGAVTPVKRQGTCGACWASASTAALEAAYHIRTGELLSLSEQELLDCDVLDLGCVGGDTWTAYQWMQVNGGIATEAEYPYTSSTYSASEAPGVCDKRRLLHHAVTISGYKFVESYSEDALMAAVARQPVVVPFDAGGPEFRDYRSGIYDGPCSADPNHDLTLVGYGKDPEGTAFWIAKNSWGDNRGVEGYVYLKKNILAQP